MVVDAVSGTKGPLEGQEITAEDAACIVEAGPHGWWRRPEQQPLHILLHLRERFARKQNIRQRGDAFGVMDAQLASSALK